MKGTIEIIIRKNEDGTFWTEVKKDIPDSDKAECAKAFGEMMGQMLLGMLQGKTITQRKFEGREAAFISELMKRQGEVQN